VASSNPTTKIICPGRFSVKGLSAFFLAGSGALGWLGVAGLARGPHDFGEAAALVAICLVGLLGLRHALYYPSIRVELRWCEIVKRSAFGRKALRFDHIVSAIYMPGHHEALFVRTSDHGFTLPGLAFSSAQLEEIQAHIVTQGEQLGRKIATKPPPLDQKSLREMLVGYQIFILAILAIAIALGILHVVT